MPRKKKTDEVPDEADLQEDSLEAITLPDEDEALSLADHDEEEFEVLSEEEAAALPEEAVSGIEIQLGVLTARIEELTGIVRRLEKKLEKSGEGREPAREFRPRDGGERAPRRDFGGDRPRFDRSERDARPGGFNRDSRGSSDRGGSDRGGFNRDSRGSDSRSGGFRSERSGGFNREGRFGDRDTRSSGGGFNRDSRPGGFNRDARPSGGFGRDSRPSGDRGGFGRSDSRGGDSRPSGDDSRGFGRRKDHGFGKRRED